MEILPKVRSYSEVYGLLVSLHILCCVCVCVCVCVWGGGGVGEGGGGGVGGWVGVDLPKKAPKGGGGRAQR